MRKLFLLLPALVLALAVNAKEIEVASGTSNIIHYTIANAATEDGDVLVLTDAGPYISTAGSDDYTKLVKNLTIKAADGIDPVIQLGVPFRSTGGKSVKFIGITFDGTSLTNYDFYFRFYDNADNLEFEDCEFKNISKYIFDVYAGKNANSLKLTNCKLHDNSSRGILNRGTLNYLEINGGEIYNFTGYPVLDNYDGATLGKVKINGTEFYNNAKDIISGVATSHADSCIINNCYFHNNSRSAVYFAASTVEGTETCDGVIVKNSTFANNDLSASSRSVIDVQNYGAAEVSNVEVSVDHCTFYNNTTTNFDYSCVRSRKSTKVSITNSIFAYPSAIDFYATNCYGGTISNTLVYNLSRGHRSSGGAPAITNTITADPLFADAANGDFSLAGDWVTPSISPARGAANDGSDLGDPRWYSEEVLPSSDFVAPYAFIGAKAVVRDNMELDGNNYIHSKSAGGSAIWKIHAMRAGNVQVTLNMDPDGQVIGHTYHVEVFDANGNSMGEVNEGGWYNNVDDKVLPGTIAFPAEGDYKIVLTNSVSGTKSTIKGITLAYVGGAIVNVPAEELLGTEAVRVDAGHLKVTKLANGDLQYGDNQYPLDEYVYWNINATKLGDMKVTLNVVAPGEGDPSSHEFLVELYSNLNESPISSSAEVAATSGTGARVLPTAINIPAVGNYIVKLTNKKQWSSAILHSVEFIYSGGATVNIPNVAIPLNEVILSDGATRDNEGLHFKNAQYVEWNIHATEGLYTFAATCTSSNYSNLTIKVKQGTSEKYSYTPQYSYTGDKVISSPQWLLDEGDYTLELSNPTSGSGYITTLSATAATDVFILDENTEDDGSIAVADGNTYKFLLKRSFTADKYYTICLPVSSWDSELKLAFGADYELWQMSSATQSGDEINLNFTQINGESFHAGMPYLIKPSINVENPIFYNEKTIHNYTYNNVQSFDAADFVGSFYKTEIPAGESNLYLQNNELFYNANNDTPIKGTRVWIRLKQQAGNQAPARARIVLQNQVATSIDLVKDANNGTIKTIENGQLVIIRDGIKYNVMGARLQ